MEPSLRRLRLAWCALAAALYAAALAARLHAVAARGEGLRAEDEPVYLDLGVGAARLGVFASEPAVPTAERAPAAPAWIALTQAGRGPASVPRLLRLQAAVGALAAPLLFILGAAVDRRRGGSVGLAAGLAAALHPDLVKDAAVLRTEWLDAVLVAALAVACVRWARAPGPRRSAALGLCLGAALLSRSFLCLFPAAAAAAGLALRRRFPEPRRWLPALAAACVLTLSPWIVRNGVLFREFIPFERGAAALSLYYSSLCLPGSAGLADYEALALASNPALAGLDSVAKDSELGRMARRNVRGRPRLWLRTSLGRLSRLWAGHLPLLVAALAAWTACRRRPEAWALGGLWAYYNLHMFFDEYALRLHPALPVLIGLAAMLPLGIGSLRRRLPFWSAPAFDPGAAAALCAGGLLAPALWFLSVEAATAWPSALRRPIGQAEAKVFLDRAVADVRAGNAARAREALEAHADDYPGYAALHVTRAYLLDGAGRSGEACAAVRRAAAIVGPLGEAGGRLAEQVRESLARCGR